MEPITRSEQYLASIIGEDVELPVPQSRIEHYLNTIAQNGISPSSAGLINYDPEAEYPAGSMGAGLQAQAAETDDLKGAVYNQDTFDYSNITTSRYIISNGKWTTVSASSKARSHTRRMPVGARRIRVTAGANGAIFAFLQSYNPVTGQTPDYAANYQARQELAANASAVYDVDDDMLYFYAVISTSAGLSYTPTVTVETVGVSADGTRPVYAAFGPSTMEGLKYDSNTRGISRYAPPAYIGLGLDLETYNFSVSGTGLIAREDGDDNYMDLIYANSDTLARAGLVTLTFAYGNDVDTGLPVGVYTDYYPYDEEGYHPSGTATVSQMISAGATVMGCLNWCIKWINENFPYAQLIVIFGAPSLNRDRTVTMTAQTGSTGVAPYTLTFADPYDNPASGTLAYGIKKIGEEIVKLKAALGIPIIDLFHDGCPFSWYSTYAKKPDDSDHYALFGEKNSGGTLVWDSHPIDAGYLQYGRFLAGQLASMLIH